MTDHTAEDVLLQVWWKVRGETVGAVGLLGVVMQDWGLALDKWSTCHMFTPCECEYLTRTIPPDGTQP